VVEVFKTNVTTKNEAKKIISTLQILLPLAKINFDLEDCDNILRIEDESILPIEIINFLLEYKVTAVTLE
jgi:hypothetical protein